MDESNDEVKDLLKKDEDGNTVGLTEKGKKVLKAAKADPKGGVTKDETVLVQLEKGYMFAKADGIVRYRTDEQHAAILEGNAFVEPAPRQQHPNSFR